MRPGAAAAALAALALCGLAALPAAAQAARLEELRYPPLPAFDIPQPERVVLGNGLVVMLLEDHELPLVEARALIDAGGIYESAERVGLAELTGEVLRSGGAGDLAADELDDELEAMGAEIETSISTGFGSARMSCLAEDFAEVLAVFADVLRRPRLAADRLELARTALIAEISRQNDSPQSIAFREIDELVYGEASPYARNPTYATVAAVSRDDVVEWHRRFFQPNRIVLGLAGDFDRRRALALVEELFGDWPRGPERQPPQVAPPAGPEPAVYFVEKSDVTQSSIAMGDLGIRRDDPDYYAVELMNQVFSGAFASRLFNSIRSEKGLAYGVFGSVGSAFDHRGRTRLYMSTKVETTGAGIAALLEETRDMVRRPPGTAEVDTARAGILNSFIFNSDSTSEILNQQLVYEFYGYPLDWLSRYRAGIEAVTAADVARVAAKYLAPERFAILVVGPSAGLDRPLADFGPVIPRDVTIPEPPAAASGVPAGDEG